MSEIRISSRYAKSLLELASETGNLESVYKDMQLLAESFKGSRELVLAMQSPIIKSDKKLAILNALFGGKVSSLSSTFFEILTRKNRESALFSIAKEFLVQYNLVKGIQKAQLYTPVKIDDTLRQQFTKLVEEKTGKKAEIEEHIKQDLIGGYVLRIGDMQLDNSVKSKLQKIKNNFTENQYIPKL